jgi:hypothetical protein
MSWNYFIANLLEPISYGICFFFFIFYTRHERDIKWRILLAYYFLATLLMWRSIYSTTNLEIYNLLCLITFVCLGGYFYYTYHSLLKKRLVIILGILHAGYYVVGNFYYAPKVFDSAGYVFLSFSIVVLSFMYLHQMLNNVTEEPLSLNFNVWFVSSQLIYYLGSFFVFLTYGYLTQKLLTSNLYSIENRIYLSRLWYTHNVLLFLISVIISAGILWTHYHRRSPS